jgi:membrane protease YdiL (CAAX protease family)
MFKLNQSEIIRRMSQKELLLNLYLSQFLFLILAVIIGSFTIDSLSQFSSFFRFDFTEVFLFGGGIAVLIIGIDLILWNKLPSNMVDDGGINAKIFGSLSVLQILILTLVIALCEELLFRGVLQPFVGYFWASILFALLHIRYLRKIVLLLSVIGVSFLFGGLFHLFSNLYVTIFSHFLIDFVLGLLIRYKLITLR